MVEQNSVLWLCNVSTPCGTLRKIPPVFSVTAACISRNFCMKMQVIYLVGKSKRLLF